MILFRNLSELKQIRVALIEFSQAHPPRLLRLQIRFPAELFPSKRAERPLHNLLFLLLNSLLVVHFFRVRNVLFA